ncbi:MAG: hypothetical protein UY35_C0002G0024 [Candidatus Saccharibacteria bacterium GW2011_GWC2_48_9]|nr:MAG: hypothetical protein UY35_C0002G0024 [Candidatus Saccharibacteria bacterium GW2011_GWC2_48_9]
MQPKSLNSDYLAEGTTQYLYMALSIYDFGYDIA